MQLTVFRVPNSILNTVSAEFNQTVLMSDLSFFSFAENFAFPSDKLSAIDDAALILGSSGLYSREPFTRAPNRSLSLLGAYRAAKSLGKVSYAEKYKMALETNWVHAG